MDLQFYGANCISLSHKKTRVVIDDNLSELGAKSIIKPDDVALFTQEHSNVEARLVFDGPGEYEVSDISIMGIAARSHMDEPNKTSSTIFKLMVGEESVLVTGHIYPDLNEMQLENIGPVDVLVVPVGGNGYTIDPTGAIKLIKSIEPKLVVPTHYADKSLNYPVSQTELTEALREMAMEPRERLSKLKLKPGELSDTTQLIVVEKI